MSTSEYVLKLLTKEENCRGPETNYATTLSNSKENIMEKLAFDDHKAIVAFLPVLDNTIEKRVGHGVTRILHWSDKTATTLS